MSANITYLFDPLCGWCYGAAPAMHYIALGKVQLTLAPIGLFWRQNVVSVSEFSEMARVHDQRIEAISGQSFSQDYFDKVLNQKDGKVDSYNATLALTAVHMVQPTEELVALAVVQAARYREGEDITALPLLNDLLARNGWRDAAELLRKNPESVRSKMDKRIASARALARRIGSRGVPTLVLQTKRGVRQIDSAALFQPKEQLVACLDAA